MLTMQYGLSRRGFLHIGGLCVGGLTLADLLRLEAQGNQRRRKSVIMIWLEGGPSHIDMYDLKPSAPAEIRGDYRPIRTNVPGMDICERLPEQARIANQFSIVRNMSFTQPDHRPPEELMTGFMGKNRPALGSVVANLRGGGVMPPYVQLDALRTAPSQMSFPGFLGPAYQPFIPGKDLASLTPGLNLSLERLENRRRLLRTFDRINQDLDAAPEGHVGMDAFTLRAMEMVGSSTVRDAFDVSKEPEAARARYGPATQILQARRLVEAGVQVVSVSFIGVEQGRREVCGFGGGTWDTHGNNFPCLNHLLPQLDRAVSALLVDLRDRGLDRDVTVVVWGEFGRAPRMTTPNAARTPGRGHWPAAGFTFIAGGGLNMGRVVGATDSQGGRPVGRSYTTQNVLATLYHALGINLETSLTSITGRPMPLLDDRRPIAELV